MSQVNQVIPKEEKIDANKSMWLRHRKWIILAILAIIVIVLSYVIYCKIKFPKECIVIDLHNLGIGDIDVPKDIALFGTR